MNNARMHFVPANEGRRLIVVGDRLWIKQTGEQSAGQYALMEIETTPGLGTPPHVHHREDEAFYILEGEVTFNVDGREILARPGDYVFGPRDVPHFYTNRGASVSRMLLIASPPGIEQFFEAISRPADAQPGPPDEAEIRHIAQTAPRFGLEILLPAEC